MPVSVGRKSSLKLVREAEKKGTYIAVVCQKVADTETPLFEDLHTIGTVAKIVRVLEMPDQTTTVILQGSKRIELKEITEVTPYLKGRVSTLNEEIPAKDDKDRTLYQIFGYVSAGFCICHQEHYQPDVSGGLYLHQPALEEG